jgi:acyl-CoA synthetase (AMP-forming)/AMP-acid ligase II
VAFVVKRAGSRLNEPELKAFALENAPAYQHPRSIWFLDSLPLASTNKLDRNALRELAARKLQEKTTSASPVSIGDQTNEARR